MHEYKDEFMGGSPPPPGEQVTLDNYFFSGQHLRWALRNYRALWPNQPVRNKSRVVSHFAVNPHNINSLKIKDRFGRTVSIARHLRETDVDTFLLIKRRDNDRHEILNEQYWHGYDPETPHGLFSAIKSIQATMVGALLKLPDNPNGRIDPKQPVEALIPELKGSGYEGATVRQVLDMQSGIRFSLDVYRDPNCEIARFWAAQMARPGDEEVPVGMWNFVPSLKRERDHGTLFGYKETDVDVAVWSAEKATGKRGYQLLSDLLWTRLGAEHDASISVDALQGTGSMMAATTRDLGRWGVMCLQKGWFNGRQIVPRSFFEDMQRNPGVEIMDRTSEFVKDWGWKGSPALGPHPKHTGYRNFFWIPGGHEGAIHAHGHAGQSVYISPKYDTVIVLLSSEALKPGEKDPTKGYDEIRLDELHGLHEITKAVQKL